MDTYVTLRYSVVAVCGTKAPKFIASYWSSHRKVYKVIFRLPLLIVAGFSLSACLESSPYQQCQYDIKRGTYNSQSSFYRSQINKLETDLRRGYTVIETKQITKSRVLSDPNSDSSSVGNDDYVVTESIVETQVPIDRRAVEAELSSYQKKLVTLEQQTQKLINKSCAGLSHVVPD